MAEGWDIVSVDGQPYRPPPQVVGEGKPYVPNQPGRVYAPWADQSPSASISVAPSSPQPSSPASRQGTIDFWKSQGAPEHVARGIANRVSAESSYNPGIMGDSNTSGGLYQHHADRLVRLKAFAESQSKDWRDPGVQHQFAASEVKGGDSIAASHWNEILAAKDEATAERLWDRFFERSAGGPGRGGPLAGSGGRGGNGGWEVTSSGKWNVSPSAIESAQKEKDASLFWMSPEDYKSLVGSIGESIKPSASLNKALEAGEQIKDIPSLTVKTKDGKYEVVDQDGLRRAQAAIDAGVDLIPVSIKGAKAGGASEIVGLKGTSFPFDFKPYQAAQAPKPMTASMLERVGGELGNQALGAAQDTFGLFAGIPLGAARPVAGAARLLAEGASAAGIPGGEKAAELAKGAGEGIEKAIESLPRSESLSGLGPTPSGTAALGDIAAGLAVPAGQLANIPRVARPLAAAGIGAGMGAVQPVQGGNYWPQVGQNALVGAGIGGGLQAAGEAVNLGANALRHVVSKDTVTQAVSRLLGENTKKLTPDVLQRVKRRIQNELERIERNYDVKVDQKLVNDLVDVAQKAMTIMGNEAAPVLRAIDNIFSRVNVGGIIPGKSAASLWHKGSRLDTLTESKNPEIASFAQQAQSAVRSALNRSLPPDEAAAYTAARNQWRDLKIAEKSLRPGQVTVDPSKLNTQITRRFPNFASSPGGPPMLELGRAVGETWQPGTGRYGGGAGGVVGAVLGHALMPGLGTVLGGVGGSAVGHLALDRLAQLRLSGGNALKALRGPAPTRNAMTTMGQSAAPGAAAVVPLLAPPQ